MQPRNPTSLRCRLPGLLHVSFIGVLLFASLLAPTVAGADGSDPPSPPAAPVGVVAEWDILNANAGLSNMVNVASADPNVSAGSMVASPALSSPVFLDGSFFYIDFPAGSSPDVTRFFTLTITPDNGYDVRYTDMTFSLSAGSGGNPTPDSFEIWAGIGGSSPYEVVGAGSIPLSPVPEFYTIDISQIGTTGSPVQFLFFFFDHENDAVGFLNAPGSGFPGQNLFINGEVLPNCEGAIVDLTPPNAPVPNVNEVDNSWRGFYATAMQDFEMRKLGMEIDLVVPQTIIARVYSASGVTRGALLAQSSVEVTQAGAVMHYVPLNYTLRACEEYDINMQWGDSNKWPWWSEAGGFGGDPVEFDAGGVIRIRNGEVSGNADAFSLGHFALVGEALSSPLVADLDPVQGTSTMSSITDNEDRGIFMLPEETFHLNSFGWEADLVAPQTLTANLYESSGLLRGALLATGTLDVTQSGMRWHDVPINYVLEEGREYDLSIVFGMANSWPYWNEGLLVEPYTTLDVRVIDAHEQGTVPPSANLALPHYRVNYGNYVGGFPTDLGNPAIFPPPNQVFGSPNLSYGAYIESLIDQEIFSLGWMADVPEGETITARVYEATGTTRGALISEGTILSSGPGMRWHDMPVAASLTAGADYDIAIEWAGVNEWRWWDETFYPPPYDVLGQIRIVDGEGLGGAAVGVMIHMRANTCNATATGIDDPVVPPRFALGRPYPNPARDATTIGYSLDEEGPVEIAVYDVKGRLVETVSSERRPVGTGEVRLDTSSLAAGVYFVKMSVKAKSVSRKITVVR